MIQIDNSRTGNYSINHLKLHGINIPFLIPIGKVMTPWKHLNLQGVKQKSGIIDSIVIPSGKRYHVVLWVPRQFPTRHKKKKVYHTVVRNHNTLSNVCRLNRIINIYQPCNSPRSAEELVRSSSSQTVWNAASVPLWLNPSPERWKEGNEMHHKYPKLSILAASFRQAKREYANTLFWS